MKKTKTELQNETSTELVETICKNSWNSKLLYIFFNYTSLKRIMLMKQKASRTPYSELLVWVSRYVNPKTEPTYQQSITG